MMSIFIFSVQGHLVGTLSFAGHVSSIENTHLYYKGTSVCTIEKQMADYGHVKFYL